MQITTSTRLFMRMWSLNGFCLLIFLPPTLLGAMAPPVSGSLSWGNGFAAFNQIGNHMYHTGIDFGGPQGSTVIRAADSGAVRLVEGLAPQGGGPETIQIWNDSNDDGTVDSGELSGRIVGRSGTHNNHGLGIVVIIEHSPGRYSLYGHLDAVKKDVWDAITAGNTLSVAQGQAIGVMGRSQYNTLNGDFGVHLHFEVKTALALESPRSDANGQYWGYTPDLPDWYGYRNPFLEFFPPPQASAAMVGIKVIAEERGAEVGRGVRVYAGPGVNYSVLGWTGLNQVFVANGTALSTTPGDAVSNRLWYRVHRLGRLSGTLYGWIASRKSDGAQLIREESGATIVEIANDGGLGWRLKRDPALDCGTTPANCARVWDNLYRVHRNVLAWNELRFVRADTASVSGQTWHAIHIPKLYFPEPQSTAKQAPYQDNVVGEIGTVWLTNGAVNVVSAELSPPRITTSSPLPSGTAGAAYSHTLVASGGTTPYTWSITAGSLPTGLSLSSGGVIGGTPASAATVSFTVQVTGNNRLSSAGAFNLPIDPAPTKILAANVPVSGLAGATGSQKVYRISVPAGQAKLTIQTFGGGGDCDVYVKSGSAATTSNYTYRSAAGGNIESILINNPAVGDWYILLYGYSAYSGMSLVASYGTPDLTGSAGNIDRTVVTAGESLRVTLSVINQGNAASGATSIYFYLRSDPNDFGSGSRVGQVNLGALNPGQTAAGLVFTYVVPLNMPSGTYALSYWIDGAGLVTETDENNNRGTWQNIRVSAAPTAGLAANVPLSGLAGATGRTYQRSEFQRPSTSNQPLTVHRPLPEQEECSSDNTHFHRPQ